MTRIKAITVFSSIFIALIAIGVFYLTSQNMTLSQVSVSADIEREFTIVIDAGHGGFDGGAVAKDGTCEKNINLNIALELKEILKAYPVKVVMVRESDISLDGGTRDVMGRKQEDLQCRKEMMEEANADLIISIHLNSYPDDESVYGAQVFYPKREQKRTNEDDYSEQSKIYAESVQEALETGIDDGRERKAMAKDDTYLLKNIETPMILVECGFLSNVPEKEKLKTAEYQGLLAEKIWEGINNCLNIEKSQKIQIIQNANKEA